MPSITAVTIFIFGLSAFNHGVSNLISPRKALAAKQLQDSALPALNSFSVAIIGIGIYYMLAAYQENRGFFALTLGRFISARIFWVQGPAWRVIATWEAFSAGLTAVALAYEGYYGSPVGSSGAVESLRRPVWSISANPLLGWRYTGVWKQAPKNKALNLFLVSKQFHVEVQDVIRRLPNNYHVDIMFVKNYGLWTTSDFVKRPISRYIDKVTSTFRIFEPTDDLDDRFEDSLSFQGGDGGPGAAVWAFYDLLVSLSRHGPGYPGRQNSQGFIIKVIEVDVVTPTDGAAHTRLACRDNDEPWWLRWSDIEDGSEPVPEKRLANYMTTHLDAVLNASTDAIPYCKELYEHITESITFQLNGQEWKKRRMDDYLEKCNPSTWPQHYRSSRRCYAREIRRWLRWVRNRRFAIIIGAGPTSGRGIARVLAQHDSGNLAVALLARNADNLNNLRDSLRKETNGVLQSFPTDTQPENLRKAFKDIANHADFKDLKLKLAIYHVKHASKKPFLEETPEDFNASMQTYTTGAVVFAQEALKLMYEQNGGQTLLADTNGAKKGTIIFTGTLGAMRTNTGYAAYGATRASARMVAQAIAKEHSKFGVQCVHAIANGRITDEDTEETRTGKHMRAEDVGQTYLWLSQQPSSLWVHELDLRPAQESF
ncbi:hypothetical protein FGADI_974 [Fusarium gaditjirri]|uniref:Oxidoreductase n=1 Tax=Fusarium gaditjirri TaxID=282569 RepID=A0A8H4TM91_9HYPO|nr:hypothetical protein FGADI_974 [Fusarium gaditjirri]